MAAYASVRIRQASTISVGSCRRRTVSGACFDYTQPRSMP